MTTTARTSLLLAVICALVFPRNSSAEIDVTSKTYVRFFQDARDLNYTPLNEYVELDGRDQDQGKWDFHISAWGAYDFKTTQYGDKTRDELTYAYLRYSPYQDKRLLFNAGRHYVFEGVASEQIDGISARWEATPSSGLSLFGGSPVVTAFDSRGGDAAYGGRVYQRISSRAELGLSMLYETNDKARFREETGVDVWFLPYRKVEVKGHSFYNNITEGWGEHAYTLRIFPVNKLTLSGLFSRTNYDDAFATRTLSVFSPEFLGEHETLTKKSGLAEYRFNDSVRGVVDYSNYAYRIMGGAAYFGGGIFATKSRTSAGATFHRMEGDVDRLRYREIRLYIAEDVAVWRCSFDVISHHYDQPFNGLHDAYSLNGTVRYAINESLTSNLSVDYSKTPDFLRNTTVLLNLVYNFKSGR
jgi:hypothetical protein